MSGQIKFYQVKFYQVRGKLYTADSFASEHQLTQRAASQRLNQWKNSNQGDYAFKKLMGQKRGCTPATATAHTPVSINNSQGITA